LIVGQLLGQILALFVLARVWPLLLEALSATRHLAAMRHVAVRYSHFAIYGAPQSVLNSLSGNVPTLLLTGFFGANETGLFWLAYRILILPNQVLVESMRSVLFQKLNEVHLSGESMQPLMRKAALQLAMLCGPIALVLLAFGPYLFAWVFGPNWARAGTDAQILALSWMLGNVSVPASIGAVILGLQRSYFLLELVMLGVRAIGICVGALLHSSSVALILFSAAAGTSSMLLMLMVTVADRRNRTAITEPGERRPP
jgi:O-antigen/teichoic acid export membrane protein